MYLQEKDWKQNSWSPVTCKQDSKNCQCTFKKTYGSPRLGSD